MGKIKRILLAESLKLKSTPVIYMGVLAGLFIAFLAFMSRATDVHSLAWFGGNPWDKYAMRGIGTYALFILCPFAILLVHSVVFVERQARSWKYLYTMPTSRGAIYFSKILMIVAVLIVSVFWMMIGTVLSGYLLDLFFPELELSYYSPNVNELLKMVFRFIGGALGVIGIQYFLSLVFKHFLIPLGIGMLGYITGLILSVADLSITIYFPYAYPMIGKDYGMFESPKIEPVLFDWLTNVELYSMIYFVIFVTLGFVYESNRQVME